MEITEEIYYVFIETNRILDSIYPNNHTNFLKKNMPDLKKEIDNFFDKIHKEIFNVTSHQDNFLEIYCENLEDWLCKIEKSIRIRNVCLMFEGKIIE